MATNAQFLTAGLLARFLTLSATVTLLLALVDTAPQGSTTDFATSDFAEPAGLVLDDILTTQARFCCQIRTFGAVLFVTVTVMTDLRVAAALRSLARKSTQGRPGAAGEWRLQHSTATVTANLVKNCISTSPAWSFVAKFLAPMLRIAAFQLATARSRADVLCLKVICRPMSCRVQRAWLPAVRLSLGSFALSRTAVLATLVSSAIERNAADAHTLWRFLCALVANCVESVPSASASDGNCLHAGPAFALMTRLLALVTAIESVVTWL